MNIVRFTSLDRKPVSVNLDAVAFFEASDGHTRIVFSTGVDLTVSETYDDVTNLINPPREMGF